MTVNYFIKCPTCNTITRMRTPAGYIYKTPVRIHCGKCNTLLTGEFVSDNEKEKLIILQIIAKKLNLKPLIILGKLQEK